MKKIKDIIIISNRNIENKIRKRIPPTGGYIPPKKGKGSKYNRKKEKSIDYDE